MSSTQEMQEKSLDLTPLNDTYDIVGEIGRRETVRIYPGKRKADGRDVLVAVMRAAADVSQGKAIAQFAADVNLLAGLKHPNVPQVLEGRWIGDDAFALVTDRIQGTTLAELLKGERLTNPRIAAILGDIDGVLEWARGERLSHRNVTPDGVWIERGTGKVYVTLSPTDAPKTNRPDPRDDARTLGTLAMTMLTAKPMADDHAGTLANMRPDLPQRVVDAVERVAACTINDEEPNISTFLASIAMADAIKEGEVEVARVDAEFRAQMKAEREMWEAEQQACQLSNEMQAKKFAEERAEYERRAAKEREQLTTARAEIDKRRTEVQEARSELDQARAAYKQKKAELEARAKQVDKHMSELEKQKRSLEKRTRELETRAADLEQKNQELMALTALAASGVAATGTDPVDPTSMDGLLTRLKHADDINRPIQAVAMDDVLDELDEPPHDDIEMLQEAIVAEEPDEPWKPIEAAEPWAVPLDSDEPVQAITYEAAAIPEPEKKKGRAGWVVPASIAGFVVLLVGTAYGVSRRESTQQAAGSVAAILPRAQLRTDTAAIPNSAIGGATADATGGATLSDSATFTAIRDSIVAADAARRVRRLAAAAEAERLTAQTVIDSKGEVWSLVPPPPVSDVQRADSIARARRDTIRPRPDTIRPRPDTLVRPRPDTGRVIRRR